MSIRPFFNHHEEDAQKRSWISESSLPQSCMMTSVPLQRPHHRPLRSHYKLLKPLHGKPQLPNQISCGLLVGRRGVSLASILETVLHFRLFNMKRISTGASLLVQVAQISPPSSQFSESQPPGQTARHLPGMFGGIQQPTAHRPIWTLKVASRVASSTLRRCLGGRPCSIGMGRRTDRQTTDSL